MEEIGGDVQPIFTVKCWVYKDDVKMFVPLDVEIVTDDTIEVARTVIATATRVESGRIAMFFGGASAGVEQDAYEVGRGWHVNLRSFLSCESGVTPPPFGGGQQLSIEDMISFEHGHVLCELKHFSRNLLVVIYMEPRAVQFWPFLHFNYTNMLDYTAARVCKRKALSLGKTPSSLGSISEEMEVRCVVEFRMTKGKPKSMIPEYAFRKITLGPNVPFAMRRCLSAASECPIMIYEPSAGACKRHWPFWTLRCNRSIRPTGIVFRVVGGVQIEWLPNGNFRATVDQYSVAYDAIKTTLEEDLMHVCREGFYILMEQLGLPDAKLYESKFSDVQFNYFVFAAIPDIRRLVDDQIRELLFIEPSDSRGVSEGGGDDDADDDVIDDDAPLVSSSSRSDDNNPYFGGYGAKSVSLMYEPAPMREALGVSQCNRLVVCKIIRSTSNGVVCRVRLRHMESSLLFALHAVMAMRYMIVQTIPREYDKPHSKLGLERIDPELYNSVKNSGLSRKVWTFYEKTTDCKRCRRAVPLNPNNERDMERYASAAEAGPLLRYRGYYYGSPDDENENGVKIRALREKAATASTPKGKKKKKKMNADLVFFGLPILKSIDEQKYRTQGYEGEEFRFVPASIRYYHGMRIPQRHLATMAPLFRRGIVNYEGKDAENVLKQLREFSEKANIGIKYVIKANKTLGPGEYGELPPGTLREFAAKIAPTKRVLRRGVSPCEDGRYASLHALLDDPMEIDDDVVNHASVRDDYVRKKAEEMLRALPKNLFNINESAAAQSYCELFSVYKNINVVVFHFSYTRPDEIAITFIGGRYVTTQPTIMLLQSGDIYEPICIDNDSVIQSDDPISRELLKLYEAFCPHEFQLYKRIECLGSTNIECQVLNKRNQFVGVQMKNGFIVPMIMRPTALLHMAACYVDTLAYNSAEDLLRQLHQIATMTEDMKAYLPKSAIIGPEDGLVHAIVLSDIRLICPLRKPCPAIECMGIFSFEQNVSYMGVPNSALPKEIELALGSLTDVVRTVFRRILYCIYGWAKTTTLWESIKYLDCRTRRREIQLRFVEPAMCCYNDIIPIDRHIMCAMLVAWCDHREDPDTWLHDAFEFLPDDGGGAGGGGAATAPSDKRLHFETPKEYLLWLARRNTK